MVEADKVEVYLERYSDGVRYNEYSAPRGTRKYTGFVNEKYVEIGTDERFRVVVKLLPKFKFLGHPTVRVEFRADSAGCIVTTLFKRRLRYASPSDQSHREVELDEVDRCIDGVYMNCGLTFGALKLDDETHLGDQQILEEADETGRITVKLRRGRYENRKAVEVPETQFFNFQDHVDRESSCKKVVHKHQVSHVLKYVPYH